MTPRRRWRAAIVGTGRIGSRLEKDPLREKPHSHAGWYAAHPRVELVAGADVDGEALAEFGRDWGLPPARLYTDYRAMLDRERPDIVSVCAYAPERVEMCETAARAGARALWIEKAVACSVAEAAHLHRVLCAAGITAIVDQPRRADPRYRAVRRLVQEGRFGALETVHALFSGHFLHTGTHAWDVLEFWCGAWERLSAWLEPPGSGALSADGRQPPAGGAGDAHAVGERDRGGHAHVEFRDGAHAFVSGRRKGGFVFQFDLLFERGRVQLGNDVWQAWEPAASSRYEGFLEFSPVEAADLVTPEDIYPRPMLHDLVHALEAGEPPLMRVEHAVASLTMGLAAFASDRAGHVPVTPGDVPRDLRVESR